ncbi:DUF397 domain-containing protein [Streptomyces sp. WM6386]|uniref:DUF397 domain-containing protein n=1 Tax=Streptomyces sp. WM6386 TaxID=1415558 RepID=UPI002D21B9C2|nr:DUF397 domain-containing protein [Streptomyces sp. WM6386]
MATPARRCRAAGCTEVLAGSWGSAQGDRRASIRPTVRLVRRVPLPPAQERRSSPAPGLRNGYSADEGNECVEVAAHRTQVAVRDSKALGGDKLIVSAAAFAASVNAVTQR